MITVAEKSILRKRLQLYEGNIPHMYLDSNGYVTVGVGHLITNLSEAKKLLFVDVKTGKKASSSEIKTDYDNVNKQAKNRIASYYKKYTKLILKQAEIDNLTNKHINSFYFELKKIYQDFDKYPTEVRLALFDLIFNLGMPTLKNKWPTFNKYIKIKDWQQAANNSKRKPPVSAARNKYVKDLLEKAANKAKKQP
ncbi:MAG: hypothetical protein KZQ99_06640 [Candidatus Thiodiazotropha sp. (ex Dulcina madagascariensis)]|nr:hypothetical protein [Candidatus Thiodiazotropha sp. (ex Epidulcina cf. delphinae)]MCU7923153.1 hypothetical protein [Candidatus Thiodiazotropha sp. (ex Dulcina madagascariensis)]MCU7928303.1 hypothetical protein [Candidatus Thiodiazotropha sp. (ex Dulcina madagascariensis)]MCU7934543.1 hypothetical protein [Candidatus Thiodiazotropha sp. (ex Dulcina madagascariensis)]